MITGKTALITGAASGIGRRVALMLASQGARSILFDLNQAGLDQTAASIRNERGTALPMVVDVANAAEVADAVQSARAQLGAIAILVNVAGISDFTPFLQITAEHWRRMLAVHLDGSFFCTQAVVPDMIAAKWGRIVNTSSVAGLNGGGPALAHYAAAKGGILGFTKALAHELGPSGITVNAIAPGLIDTPMVRQTAIGEKLLARMGVSLPVQRVGSPEDVAAACAYLVSEEAGFVTGQVISPNGGAYL